MLKCPHGHRHARPRLLPDTMFDSARLLCVRARQHSFGKTRPQTLATTRPRRGSRTSSAHGAPPTQRGQNGAKPEIDKLGSFFWLAQESSRLRASACCLHMVTWGMRAPASERQKADFTGWPPCRPCPIGRPGGRPGPDKTALAGMHSQLATLLHPTGMKDPPMPSIPKSSQAPRKQRTSAPLRLCDQLHSCKEFGKWLAAIGLRCND